MRQQQTVGRAMTCSGVGLHTGKPARIKLCPAPADTGIVFIRNENGRRIALSASVGNLIPAELCTTISANGAAIKTVEHVLAALSGLSVDNAFIELDGEEVPVMDGSADPFVRLIRAAGIVPQDLPQPFLKITQPIEVVEGHKRIVVEPSPISRITYSIQYDHPLIQRQTYVYDWSVSLFDRTIAAARTFGFMKEVKYLWSRGVNRNPASTDPFFAESLDCEELGPTPRPLLKGDLSCTARFVAETTTGSPRWALANDAWK